jgi:hypothetical protein
MENLGKQRGFDKELAGRACPENRRSSVKRSPIQPKPPLFDEINGLDFVALPEKVFISRQ